MKRWLPVALVLGACTIQIVQPDTVKQTASTQNVVVTPTPTASPTPSPSPTPIRGTANITLQIADGGYYVSAINAQYTKASINHVLLKLFVVNGTESDTGVQKSVPQAQLDNPVTFSDLSINTNYLIKAFTYSSTDESALISSPNASASLYIIESFPTANINLPIKLIDVLFSGQGTSSAWIIPGGYTSVGSETVN